MSDVLRDLVSKATPGPWSVSEIGTYPYLDGEWQLERVRGYYVSEPYRLGDGEDGAFLRPDARLMALAPDLALLVADLRDELVDVTARWPERTSTRALLVRVDRLTEDKG